MLVFLLAQAGVPFTSGFLAKFYVISAAVQRGQYALAIIAMLAAAVAAFFYLRVALLMYSSDPGESAGEPPILGAEGPEEDGALTAGLKPIPSLDSGLAPIPAVGAGPATMTATTSETATTPASAATLEAPPVGPISIPFYVGLVLAVSVAFTIFAGVSSPIITLARQATMMF
jgi:NADH:ubiquinone oxidoreductase subunit 5 (subunit L)/multisubunit Na+/H+ antiporter MnhA subunit